MADRDTEGAKDYHVDVPARSEPFFLKGSGRNIFQSENPPAMIQAVRKVVHERFKPHEACEYYQTLKHETG